MSRRTEHEEDVIINQEDIPLDDDDEICETETEELYADDIPGWDYWHQDHLLNMYFSLKEYCEMNGLHFMDTISFHQLCVFLYANGRG